MEKLVVLSDDESPQEFPLVDRRLLIGRDATCDICLSDRSVSRHHATLMRVFRGFSIEDERSTNGTRVNGSVVTKRFLKHGDLIEIGKYSLRYIAQLPSEEMDDPDRTVVLRPTATHQSDLSPPPAVGGSVRSPFSASPAIGGVSTSLSSAEPPDVSVKPPAQEKQAAETDAPLSARAKVRFLEGDRNGEELVIDRAFFSVGKPGGDLVLINQRHNGYYLLKVGGENMPMINGQPIKAGGVELKTGDRISLGELSLEFLG